MSPRYLAILLHCIAIVETGDNPNVIGSHGEIGRHQMMPVNQHLSPEQLEREIEWQLTRRHVPVNPFNIALCWNAGWPRVIAGRAPVESYRYALRVTEIFEVATKTH